MALIVHRKSPALTRFVGLCAREAEPAGRGDGPPTPRRLVFHLFAGGAEAIDPHASSATRSTGRCRATGSVRHHPVRRSAETGLLAALAPRFGGGADGADRSPKIARVNPLRRSLRARGGASRAWRWPTDAAPIGFSPLRWRGGGDRPARIERDQVDRPLPSYGVGSTSPGSPQRRDWVASCARAPIWRRRRWR